MTRALPLPSLTRRLAAAGRLNNVARWLHDVPGAFISGGDHAIVAGVWTERTARRYAAAVGRTGRLVVLEANPTTANRLTESLADLPQVKVIAKALWRDCDGVEFFHAEASDYQGFNRVTATGVPADLDTLVDSPELSRVESTSLDALGDEIDFSRLAHISMTINGAEAESVNASAVCLAPKRPLFVATWSEFPEFGPAVESSLTERGFDVAVSTGRGAQTRWSSLDLRYVLGYHPGST